MESEIKGVITDQIDALSAGDLPRAFSYASDMLHGVFQSPENFGVMVHNGYEMILNPRDIAFQGLEPRNGALWQKVVVTDANGVPHTLLYEMIETPDGLRINSVQLVPTEQINT
ncbi:MAG: DUF4864 domain-containing protein [Deltaproteobacteria bacterium]